MTLGVPELMTKARRSLAAARRLHGDRDFDFAVSRAYYAMFYAAEALLLHRNMSFSRHARVIAALHREYVTSGELSRENHAALQRAFNDRNVRRLRCAGRDRRGG
jgi:uncharacterized protein (UPF0332 family)